jgi:D-amino-acid dehydrogenase
MNYDAIVIGSGIVGISTAYHLVGEGAKTLLIDRRDPGRETVTDISPFHITRFP